MGYLKRFMLKGNIPSTLYRRPADLNHCSFLWEFQTVKYVFGWSQFSVSILIILYLLFDLLAAVLGCCVDLFKCQRVDLSHWSVLFPGESFMENSVATSEHLKKSPLSPNSTALSPGLRSPTKLLHHNNFTGRKRHWHKKYGHMSLLKNR